MGLAALLSRILAAVAGAYALATVGAVALAHLFPAAPAEQAMIALPLSFPIFCGAIIWVFAARSATLAWSGLAAAGAASAGLILLLR